MKFISKLFLILALSVTTFSVTTVSKVTTVSGVTTVSQVTTVSPFATVSAQMTRTDKVFGTIRYIKYVPPGAPGTVKGVILYLHGAGEVTLTLNDLERNEIPKLFKSPSVVTKDYVIICPQLDPPATSWSSTSQKYLLELIERTSYEYQNTNIILTGLSLGGFTSLGIMREAYLKYGHNHFFTAVGLMCAKITNVSGFDVTPYIGTPIKLWHGTTDTTNPISNMRTFTSRVNAGGGSVTLVEYAGVGHDVWSLPRGYADANFWTFADV
jgi:predicted peptidase